MAGPARMGRKAAASLIFGMGSFILMADITQLVITNGDQGGNIFDMGFPSLLGMIGIFLWAVGLVLLIIARKSGSRPRKGGTRSIFLGGKNRFKCSNCGSMVDASRVDYHRRIECNCGAAYDVFEDPDST